MRKAHSCSAILKISTISPLFCQSTYRFWNHFSQKGSSPIRTRELSMSYKTYVIHSSSQSFTVWIPTFAILFLGNIIHSYCSKDENECFWAWKTMILFSKEHFGTLFFNLEQTKMKRRCMSVHAWKGHHYYANNSRPNKLRWCIIKSK